MGFFFGGGGVSWGGGRDSGIIIIAKNGRFQIVSNIDFLKGFAFLMAFVFSQKMATLKI